VQYADPLKVPLFHATLIFVGWKMEVSKLNYREHTGTAFVVYAIYVVGVIYLADFVIAR
jgi:hypothetical protein